MAAYDDEYQSILTTADEQTKYQESQIDKIVQEEQIPYSELTIEQRAAMTYEEQLDYIQKEREARLLRDAVARAESDPMFDYRMRPQAPPGEKGYFFYYSWIGGASNGSWELYRTFDSLENQMLYGSRVFGGPTQASTSGQASDANSLIQQPQPYYDDKGNFLGYSTSYAQGGGTGGGGTGIGGGGGYSTTSGGDRLAKLNPQFGGTGSGSGFNTGMSGAQVDAIAAISSLLSSYGIGQLSDAITNAVRKGYTADTITLIMQDPNSSDPLAVAFQQRFPANKQRLLAGKPVLSPAEYLAAERSYAQVFQSYGLGTMAKRDYFNKFIAGDVSAAEVSDRISLAVNRVQNADSFTKQALGQFYPMLNQGDIVAAMLDPQEGLPALQRKVQISEIGGASLAQSLTTSFNALTAKTGFANVQGGTMGAEALATLGITKEQARQGYANVAEVVPRSEFLSAISGGGDYTQLQAEQEQFQGLASAKRARQELTSKETSRFSGSSGLTRASLANKGAGNF